MDIINILPIGIGVFKNSGLNSKQLNFLKNLPRAKNKGNFFTKNIFVLDLPELADLKEFILSSLNKYFEEIIVPKYEVRPIITQSWANFNFNGSYHHRHNHPNSYLSGVYYVDTNESDNIVFHRPAPSSITIKPKKYNLYNSQAVWVPAMKNHLIIFPSWLDHEVETISDNHSRISLSFNSFLSGKLDEDHSNLSLNTVEKF
jgi:uncharacterized protein (TIGR02466 family)